MSPTQVRGKVVATRRVGAYHHLTIAAPGMPERTRPGNFVAVAVGGPQTSMLLRRAFSIYRVSSQGPAGGTVEIVVGVHGKGTEWLVSCRPGDVVDVVGPLGKPFALPQEPVSCVLIGGGYGSAPLFMLAEGLLARGCRVQFVLGAATEARLFGALDAKRMGCPVTVTTEDGSAGVRGRVTDVLPELVRRTASEVLYACGPMGMLRAVSDVASAEGVHSQCAVEEAMACGIGVCMTCVLPVIGADGVTRMTRSCVDGPVFRGTQVRWSEVGTVPSDTLGAPKVGAH